jgi:catechol 2,3-dioxygenase-like lactoylglutathione lyase family enzyme
MIRSLDHINVRVRDLAATLDFYQKVLGMRYIVPPGMAAGASEAWICAADGHPVLHVGTSDITGIKAGGYRYTADGSGSIHHVAFDCVEYQRVAEQLERSGIATQHNHIAAAGLRQIFIQDPDNILLELNFRD